MGSESLEPNNVDLKTVRIKKQSDSTHIDLGDAFKDIYKEKVNEKKNESQTATSNAPSMDIEIEQAPSTKEIQSYPFKFHSEIPPKNIFNENAKYTEKYTKHHDYHGKVYKTPSLPPIDELNAIPRGKSFEHHDIGTSYADDAPLSNFKLVPDAQINGNLFFSFCSF